MNIEWTLCSERMPPKIQGFGVMTRLIGDVDVTVTTACSVHNLDFIEEYEWTPYTKEKWEFLNDQ